MHSINFLIVLLVMLILTTSCGPSEYLSSFEKVELLKLDSLIIPEYRPKYFSSFCRVLFVKAYNVDIKDLETIDKENITFESKPIGGMEAIEMYVDFPEIARRARIEGDIVAELDVDKIGNTSNVKILKSLGGGIEEMVIKVLNKTIFYPAKRNKENVSCKMRIRIHFWPPEGEEDLLDRKEPIKFKSRKL